MELFLFFAAMLLFGAGAPAPALALRCGLTAWFSPRAALALSAFAGLLGASGALLGRGGARHVPSGMRLPAASAGVLGGAVGRAALLMFAARFPNSRALAQLHALPLLVLTALALIPRRSRPRGEPSPAAFLARSGFSALADGFIGAGGALLSAQPLVRRRGQPPIAALWTAVWAQLSAMALTLLSGAAEVFPARLLLALGLGAFIGGIANQRGARSKELRAALGVYLALAALSAAEQAFL